MLHFLKDMSIRWKAVAASIVMLLSMIGLGVNSYLTLAESAAGLDVLSNVSLPKQQVVVRLRDDIIATQVRLFRYTSLAGSNASNELLARLRRDILSDIEGLTDRLRSLASRIELLPEERKRIEHLLEQWQKFETVTRQSLAFSGPDDAIASAILAMADEEFHKLAADLQELFNSTTQQTRWTAGQLAGKAEIDKHLLALGGALAVLVGLIVTLVATSSIIRPIRSVTDVMKSLSAGDLDVEIAPPDRRDEIGQMVEAIAAFRSTIERDNRLLSDRDTDLRMQNARFNAALSNMTQGLSMFDARGRLVVCNERYLEIYNLPPSEVRIGTALRDIIEAKARHGTFDGDVDAYCDGILERVAKGRPSAEICEMADGRVIAIASRPIMTGGWVATHEDITDLRHAEEEAREAHSRLRDVIEAMPAGLVFYDKDERLTIWNKRYDEIFSKTSDLRVKGTRFEDILREAARRGLYADAIGREEEWIAERLAWRTKSESIHEHCLADGKWLRIEDCRSTDGGLIGVVIDITELKRREEELRVQNLRLDAALANMSQGLAMFDGAKRLVLCNDRYLEMYDLSREKVRPGCSLEELIGYRMDSGLFQGDIELYVTTIMSALSKGKTASHTVETSDGRVINVVNQPMPGGGWVTTHEDVTERRRAEERISYMARHDDLTDLASRATFRERLEHALERSEQGGGGFAVLVADLDQFKTVNDSLGHPVGDELLKHVANRLRACAGERDIIARLGGDEFAIMQRGRDGDLRTAAAALANTFLDALSAPFEIEGNRISVGASIGIAMAPGDGRDADELLKNADLALYRTKTQGRNGYRFFERGMAAEMRARHALAIELRNAVGSNDFELHYQTVVNVSSGEPCGVEALVRWNHPRHGLISPETFIPLAEETGAIIGLGEWILNQACRDAGKLPPHLTMAVNLSPAQFVRGDLFELVSSALAANRLEPGRLEVEITESVLLQQNAENLAVLHRLRSLGVSVVLDDFGTGYSSLSYLRMFPFDKIKIDKSFVSELSSSTDCSAIVAAITSLGRSLDVKTTAEGVETRHQFELLRAAGCNQVQGYLFGVPCRLSELDLPDLSEGQREGNVA